MRLARLIALLALLAWSSGMGPVHADVVDGLTRTKDGAELSESRVIERKATNTHSQARASQPSPSKYTYLPEPEYKTQMDAYRQELSAAIAANKAATNARGQCIQGSGTLNCGRFQTTALPGDPNIRQAGEPTPAAPPAPSVTPEQAAYIASARIRLTAPKPMIGPPPEINEWGMAAVGYPLWLWAEGSLNPAPVSDSVYDLAVSLDARLVSVVFDMGDGGRVNCSNVTTRWTRSVQPGTQSPTCGYTYTKPSLPDGSYTVTAHAVWAIDWFINGSTGSIPFYQSASTEIPVGELQVLVR